MFIVYDKDMNVKPFPRGVRPLDIFVHAMERRRETEIIEGRSGVITKGITSLNRPIEIEVGLQAHDTMDYRLLKSELYAFFADDEFYISETYEKGKRYKVTLLQSYIPERLNQRIARARFMLDMVNLPFAESIGTTKDIEDNGILDSDELWGFGMGLLADEESLKYTHVGNGRFYIYNAGNEHINPFEQDLKITIDQIQGSSSFLELHNRTTNVRFRTLVGASGTIVIDGPTVYRNSSNYLRNTTMRFVDLAPGWNEFYVLGASSARFAFDFRFYYK